MIGLWLVMVGENLSFNETQEFELTIASVEF